MAALVALFGIALAEPAMPDSIVRVGACATPGIAWAVYIQDTLGYIADVSALTVVNISDPSVPSVVSSLSSPDSEPLGIIVRDTLAYLHKGIIGVFSIINVSDPGTLFVVGWCEIPGSFLPHPRGILLRDTLCYVARGTSGITTINVSDPNAPVPVDTFDTPGFAMDFFVRDTIMYIADRDSLQIASIGNPISPYYLGSSPMPAPCYDVFVVDTFAYAACQSGFGFGSLEVVSVSDPSSPQIVASVDNIAGDPLDVWISGSYAYVAAADYSPVEGGVRVVDISDPLSPSLVASYDTPGDPRGVFAVGDLVFVADYDSLQILRHIGVGVEEKSAYRPEASRFRLAQNQPNPFTSLTNIRYELETEGTVTIEIHDVTGRLVRTLVNAPQFAGQHTAMWDGRDEADRKRASGVYFCRLTTESGTLSNKMLLVR